MNKNLFKQAFILSFPIMLGYIFLGMAFGILVNSSNLKLSFAIFSSLFIYSGSAQFALISFVKENLSILYIILFTLFINFRYMFYGLSLLNSENKIFTILTLSDETYALISNIDKTNKNLILLVSFLNYLYWNIGTIIGYLLKDFIRFSTKGIEFSMTALFIIICIEQYKNIKNRVYINAGFILGSICLFLFGNKNFLLFSIIFIIIFIFLKDKTYE